MLLNMTKSQHLHDAKHFSFLKKVIGCCLACMEIAYSNLICLGARESSHYF